MPGKGPGKPKGLPKTGGRVKGTPNKSTAQIKQLAGVHGPEAVQTLVRLMRDGDTDATKLSAAEKLLDRAYGRATQMVAGDPDGEAVRVVSEIILRGVRATDD